MFTADYMAYVMALDLTATATNLLTQLVPKISRWCFFVNPPRANTLL